MGGAAVTGSVGKRTAALSLALGGLLAALLLASVSAGAVRIPSGRAAAIVSHALGFGAGGGWKAWEEHVLLSIRLPRALLAAVIGGGLAVSGAVMQGVFRNPLADPSVLGVTAGAGLGAVSAIAMGLAARSALAVPFLAFVGGLSAAWLVYAIAARGGRTPVPTLLLAGIAVGTLAVALTSFVVSLVLPRYEIGQQVLYWLMGGLEAKTWRDVRMAAPFAVGGSILLLLFARDLNVLATGEEAALSLGIDVPAVRRWLLLLTSLIAGVCVAMSGTVAFVGLVVPHVLRILVGPDHRVLLPASFLGGACFLVGADLLARILAPPTEIRLGVLTSLVGGPFFLYLLIRQRRKAEAL